MLRKRNLQQWVLVPIETSSTAKRFPFSYKEKALTTLREGEPVSCSPHPPQAGPLPLKGKDLTPAKVGETFLVGRN